MQLLNYNELLKTIDSSGLDIFTNQDISNVFGQANNEIQNFIETLEKQKLIIRIEKGKYVRHNFKDEYVIGSFLTSDATIAYWSALHLHGLTDQIPNTVFLQSSRKKADKNIFGVRYRFVKVLPKKLTGFQTNGYGNQSYQISDVEKTIVDCFDLPQYAGEFPKLVRAVFEARLQPGKLINYCEAVNNIAATKKIAFLTALFEKPNIKTFVNYALSKVTNTVNLFDPWGSKEGKINSRWGLRLNISEEEIKQLKYY